MLTFSGIESKEENALTFRQDAFINPEALMTLSGHTDHVMALAVLPDGRLASGSRDHTIKMWDTKRGICVSTLSGHTNSVKALALLSDECLASSQAYSKSIKLWDLSSMTYVNKLKGHTNDIEVLKVLPDGRLASGSCDKSIRLWNTKTKECVATLFGHTDHVSALALLSNDRLASGCGGFLWSHDKSIRLWDLSTGICVAHLLGHTGSIAALAVLLDGRLASGSSDCTIKIWSVVSGSCEATLFGHTNLVLALTLLPDGYLASGSSDCTIKIWNVVSGSCEATLLNHANFVLALTLLPDGYLASGSSDCTIKVWDVGLRPVLTHNVTDEKAQFAEILHDNDLKNAKILVKEEEPQNYSIESKEEKALTYRQELRQLTENIKITRANVDAVRAQTGKIEALKIKATQGEAHSASKKAAFEAAETTVAKLTESEAMRVASFHAQRIEAEKLNKIEADQFLKFEEINDLKNEADRAGQNAMTVLASAHPAAQGTLSYATAESAKASALAKANRHQLEHERSARFEQERTAARLSDVKERIKAEASIAEAIKIKEAAYAEFEEARKKANAVWLAVVEAESEKIELPSEANDLTQNISNPVYKIIPSATALARIPFLAQVCVGVRPQLQWKKMAPGVLEDVLGLFHSAEPSEQIKSTAQLEEEPLELNQDAVFEKMGRTLFGKIGGKSERQKITPGIAIDQVLHQAAIDVLNPTTEETARWDMRKKIDRLEVVINQLQADKKDSTIPAYISDSRTTRTGSTFNHSVLSGTIFQERAKIDAELRAFRKEKKKYEEEWLRLVEHAEQTRLASSVNKVQSPEEIVAYWTQYDRDAIDAKTWAYDVARWDARAQWENAKQHDKEAALAAKKKWSALADLHESLTLVLSVEDRNRLKTHLAATDLPVVMLRDALIRTPFQTEAPVPEDTSLYEKNAQDYKVTLDEWREENFNQSFKPLETALAALNDAKKYKRPSKTIQSLAQEAEQLEEVAREEYANACLKEALQGVRRGMPHAVYVWGKRARLSAAEATQIKSAYDRLKMTAKTEDEKRKVNRAIMIAIAEEGAYEAAQKEVNRISKIEKKWRADFEIVDQATKLQVETAATDHALGNTTAWSHLSPLLKAAYNQAVESANRDYDVMDSVLYAAEERLSEANAQLGMAYHDENTLKTGHSFWRQKKEMAAMVEEAEHPLIDDHDYFDNDESSSSILSEGRKIESLDGLPTSLDDLAKNNGALLSGLEFKNPKIERANKNLLSAQAYLEGVNAAMAARLWYVDQGRISSSQCMEDTVLSIAHRTAALWNKTIEQFETSAKQFSQAAEAEATSSRFFSYLWTQVARHSQSAGEKYFEAAWGLVDGEDAEADRLSNDAEAAQEISNRLAKFASDVIHMMSNNQEAHLLSLNTQQVEKNIAGAKDYALSLNPSDPDFENTWSRSLVLANQAKVDWERILPIYEQLRAALPTNEQAACEGDLNLVKYMTAFSER